MTQQPRLSAFIDELRRRRVFRVAAFYGGIAFVIVQIIDGTFDLMGVPQWVGRVMVIILAIGFPISMILAWVFDITDEGIVRTKGRPADAGRKALPLIGNHALAIIAVLAIAFGIWGRWGGSGEAVSAPEGATGNSVAVLPFVTFSTTDDGQLFADGMTDNLITQLYKVTGLKITARTSVMQFKGTTKRMRDIGRELGVNTLVEGSVQRSAERVIITAQLIDAESETHLWAETYDRHITDIFDIQMEVAKSIAEALKATLTPEIEERMAERPTENMAAYEAYLRGIRWRDDGYGRRELKNAISSFEEATRLDPRFADAWAELAIAHLFYRWQAFDASDERLAQAEWALEQANNLAPDRIRVRLARGRYHYHGQRDYARALQEFYPALQLEPNNPLVITNIGYIERRLGNFDKALQLLLQAFELDPRSSLLATEIASTYSILDDLENATLYARKGVQLSPQSASVLMVLAVALYFQTGDPAQALAVVEGADPRVSKTGLEFMRGIYLMESGREQDAIAALRRYLKALPPGDSGLARGHSQMGWAYHLVGLADSARAEWRLIHDLWLAEFERLEFDITDRSTGIRVANVEALLGLHDQAWQHADKAVADLPITADVWNGTVRRVDQIWIYFTTGATDQAFEMLEQILSDPRYPGKKRQLQFRRWEALRADPRYPALAAKYGLPK